MPHTSATVLIIDDEEIIREALEALLTAEGYVVLTAETAGRGVEIIGERYVDVVLLDLMLPDRNGLEVLPEIRRMDEELPVVMITGHSERSRVTQARDSGVNEFVVKPLTARALLGRLDSVIMRPRPFIRCKSYFGPDRRRKSDDAYGGPYRRNTDGVF